MVETAQRQKLVQPGPLPLSVALIAKPGDVHTGVGRYVHMIHAGLHQAGINVQRVAPSVPPLPSNAYTLFRRLGMDLRTFLTNYPVWTSYPTADVYHFTSQNLATLLLFRRPKGKVVVTVHDIIPYMLRNSAGLSSYRTIADRLFDRMAMAGLKRADLLIADSHYTKQCLAEHLGIAPDKIHVVYLGIDYQRFHPMPVPSFIRERYGLPEGRRYLIYVGSEDPRKNVATLVRALADLRGTLRDVELIKVGRPHFDHERQRLLMLADNLGVRSAIHFLDDVSEEDLPLLYNLADVCVMPSLFEGFGFPVLEAMACGTPVVSMNAASLSEVVGEGGILVESGPAAQSHFAEAVRQLLSDEALYRAKREKGLAHAAMFHWESTTRELVSSYLIVQKCSEITMQQG